MLCLSLHTPPYMPCHLPFTNILMHLCSATRGTHVMCHIPTCSPHRANHSHSSSSTATLHTHMLQLMLSLHTGEETLCPHSPHKSIINASVHIHHSYAYSHTQATAALYTQNTIPCICYVHIEIQIILATPIAYTPVKISTDYATPSVHYIYTQAQAHTRQQQADTTTYIRWHVSALHTMSHLCYNTNTPYPKPKSQQTHTEP